MATKKTSSARVSFRLAQSSDVPAIGQLLAAAFSDNTAYRYIFQLPGEDDGNAHHKALVWLFTRRISMFLSNQVPVLLGFTTTDETTDETTTPTLVATASLISTDKKPNLWTMLRHGILMWPFVFGVASLQRALSLDGSESNKFGIAELSMVVVSPTMQGQGVGTELVTRILDEFGKDTEISLNTQKETNVKFYTKFGFEERSSELVNGSYTNWSMIRPANSE